MTGTQPSTVYEAFAATARSHPDRPALQVLPATAQAYGIDAGEQSYGQILALADAEADTLSKAGYATGMRVAVLLENRPAFFVTWLALNKIGASIVPINPDLRLAELEYLIGHAEPALILALAARQDMLAQAASATGVDVAVVSDLGNPPAPRANAITARPADGRDREAAILYTSGTTGNPKGCVLSNTYFLLAGDWYANAGGIADLHTDGERMITPLPLFHMNAMAYSFMAMVTVGGCLCVLDRFHPRSWWADVAASKATCLHYLGVMPSMLMGFDPDPKDQTHSVRFGFGAGVDPKLQADFEARFGFPLVEAWAMTETGAGAVIAASTPDRLVGKASIGKPAPEVLCRLVDDFGAESDQGELLVRHAGDDPRHGFFTEYYKDAVATEAAWAGGWFHTGDIVRRDRSGNIYFVDRKKNLIRRSGENIAAVEVESILMRHPDVQAAGVAPVPDPLRGDEVFACLSVKDPSPAKAEAIVLWCLDQMAYFKAPGYVSFVDELPLTATQKIQRATLKSMALQLMDDPNTVNTIALKKRQAS